MKLQSIKDSVKDDIRAILKHYGVNISSIPEENRMIIMWDCMAELSANRAYDNNHPRWLTLARVIPYDGRDYCFYYQDGANDDHVKTMLKQILKELL